MEGIQTFKGSWPWPWPWFRPYGIPSCITHRHLPTYQFHSNRRNFLWTDGRTDGRTDVRTYGRTDIFLPLILLGRLLEVDLNILLRDCAYSESAAGASLRRYDLNDPWQEVERSLNRIVITTITCGVCVNRAVTISCSPAGCCSTSTTSKSRSYWSVCCVGFDPAVSSSSASRATIPRVRYVVVIARVIWFPNCSRTWTTVHGFWGNITCMFGWLVCSRIVQEHKLTSWEDVHASSL